MITRLVSSTAALWFLIGCCTLTTMGAPAKFFLDPTRQAGPVHIKSADGSVDITTAKVAYISGTIDYEEALKFESDMLGTENLLGPRVIIINSNGGEVDRGAKMIKLMRAEQKKGVKMVCLVLSEAHSMAFNLLTACDVRLMRPGATSVVHKVRIIMPGEMMTAKDLRKQADELDQADEPYREANARAMHLTLAQYDKYADAETEWKADTLMKRGYLYSFGTIEQ